MVQTLVDAQAAARGGMGWGCGICVTSWQRSILLFATLRCWGAGDAGLDRPLAGPGVVLEWP